VTVFGGSGFDTIAYFAAARAEAYFLSSRTSKSASRISGGRGLTAVKPQSRYPAIDSSRPLQAAFSGQTALIKLNSPGISLPRPQPRPERPDVPLFSPKLHQPVSRVTHPWGPPCVFVDHDYAR